MNDDFDIDIDKIFDQTNNVKPLTQGLGFHHSLKEEKNINLEKKSKILENEIKYRARTIAKNKQESFAQKAFMGDLSAFYKDEETKDSIENVSVSNSTISLAENNKVGVDLRLIAFAVDLLVVSTIFLSIFVLSYLISGLPETVFLSAFFSKAFYIEGAMLYGLIFIFYFAFFDRTTFSSLGKNLMGIKVSSTTGKMSYYQSVLRSFLTLVSVFSCGLLNLLNITDIISSTKVSKIK